MNKTLDIRLPRLVEIDHTREITFIANIKGYVIVDEKEYILQSVSYKYDEYVIVYHIYDNGNVKELTFKTTSMPHGEIIDL
jgi:hypothetical protein